MSVSPSVVSQKFAEKVCVALTVMPVKTGIHKLLKSWIPGRASCRQLARNVTLDLERFDFEGPAVHMKLRIILSIAVVTALTCLGLYIYRSPVRVIVLGGLVIFLLLVLWNPPPKHKEFTLEDQLKGAARGGSGPPKLPEPDIPRRGKGK